LRKLKVRNLWLQDDNNYAVDVTEKILNLYNGTVGSLVLDQENDAVTPTLAFGDGDTGFYESADDTIEVSISGSRRWSASSSGIFNTSARCPFVLFSEQGSATNPVFSLYGDLDTGVGSSGDDALSLIAGGVEGIRITETAGAITTDLIGTVNAPDLVVTLPITLAEDTGVATLFNLPVSATPADGTEEAMAFMIDSDVILKVSADADSAGGIDGHHVKINRALVVNDVQTMANDDETPDVSGYTYWNTGTNNDTITDFDGNIKAGQLLVVVSKAAITYDVTDSGIKGGTTDIVTAAGDVTTFIYDGTDWLVVARMDMSDDLN